MRISDWSSDVCSSDLGKSRIARPPDQGATDVAAGRTLWRDLGYDRDRGESGPRLWDPQGAIRCLFRPVPSACGRCPARRDRKSVGYGQRVDVRGVLGGRRGTKTKNRTYKEQYEK